MYILLYWLGYDVIRKPFSTIKEQTDYRKRRNLMLSLSEQIEEFFAKDPDSESVFRSFNFWTKFAGINGFKVQKYDEFFFYCKILAFFCNHHNYYICVF